MNRCSEGPLRVVAPATSGYHRATDGRLDRSHAEVVLIRRADSMSPVSRRPARGAGARTRAPSTRGPARVRGTAAWEQPGAPIPRRGPWRGPGAGVELTVCPAAAPPPLARWKASWSFWTSLWIVGMRMGSVHHSRFSTRCPGRPACPRRAWKSEGRGDLSHHGWMRVAEENNLPYM